MKFGFRFLIPLVGLTAMSAVALADHMGDMVSVSGHARTRWEFNANNISGAGQLNQGTDAFVNRVRLNVDVAPSNTLKVRLAPEFTNTWGTAADTTPNSLSGMTAAQLAALNAAELAALGGLGNDPRLRGDATFTAHEAWMSWAPMDMVTVYLGRQALNYGDGELIGNNDWFNASNNFDAARASVKIGNGSADLFWAKISDRSNHPTGLNGAPDHDLFGLYTSWNVGDMVQAIKTADVYLFENDNRAHGLARSRLIYAGLKLVGGMSMIDYNAEVTGNFGKANSGAGYKSQKGFQTEDEIGATFMDAYRLALNVVYANSEFTDLYPTVHEHLGYADVINARNNVLQFAGKLHGKFSDVFAAELAGLYFMAPKTNNGIAGGLAAAGTSRPLGMEGDLDLQAMPEKKLNFDLGYDIFKPLGALKNAGSNKVEHKVYLQGQVNI